jgi:hypothetical protein
MRVWQFENVSESSYIERPLAQVFFLPVKPEFVSLTLHRPRIKRHKGWGLKGTTRKSQINFCKITHKSSFFVPTNESVRRREQIKERIRVLIQQQYNNIKNMTENCVLLVCSPFFYVCSSNVLLCYYAESSRNFVVDELFSLCRPSQELFFFGGFKLRWMGWRLKKCFIWRT